jgi:hypothetical protein
VLAHGERVVIRGRFWGSRAAGRRGAARVVLTISPAVRIYVATDTTDLRRSIDAFSLKSKVRTIRKARSGMAIA